MHDADLLSAILNPQTGTVAVLVVVVVMLWRSLQRSETLRDALHQARVEDARKAGEAIKEQRDYHAELREKLHQQQIQLQDVLNRATNVIERCERAVGGN